MDGTSRVYVLYSDARLQLWDYTNDTLSATIFTGPAVTEGNAGHSGLAGPLTDCTTGFTK